MGFAFALTLLMPGLLPGFGQEQRHEQPKRDRGEATELRQILEGIEHGMVALRRLGRFDELERLEQIAEELREKIQARGRERREDPERRAARRHLELMRHAHHALERAHRPDAADIIRRAIRAREVTLEGRRDEEANHIRAAAPGREDQAELLHLASRVLREMDEGERAEDVERLARSLARNFRGEREGREGPHSRDDR